MRRVSTVIITACAFVLATLVSLHAQNPGGSPEGKKMKNPVASNAASIEAGKTLYNQRCKFCHGEDLKGAAATAPKTLTTIPSNLIDAKWDRGSTDGEIFLVLKEGAGPKFEMKGVKGVSDDDLWKIVNYVRSAGPKTATTTTK
jgi:mono/diheme cytochrome c family protein